MVVLEVLVIRQTEHLQGGGEHAVGRSEHYPAEQRLGAPPARTGEEGGKGREGGLHFDRWRKHPGKSRPSITFSTLAPTRIRPENGYSRDNKIITQIFAW